MLRKVEAIVEWLIFIFGTKRVGTKAKLETAGLRWKAQG